MFKAKFTALALMLLSFIANATAQKNVVTSTLELQSNEIWGGYASDKFSTYRSYSTHFDTPCNYDAAIKIPASSWMLAGKKITGIRFSFINSSEISNVKIWISKELPNKPQEADFVCDAVNEVTGLENNAANEVRFSKPYVSDGVSDVYVGYSFTINGWDAIPMEQKKDVLDVNFVRDSERGTWETLDVNKFGIISMQVLLQEEKFQNAVSMPTKIGSYTEVKGQQIAIPLVLENNGANGVSSFRAKMTINGQETYQDVKIENKVTEIGGKVEGKLLITAPSEQGVYSMTVVIDQVNGAANEHSIEGKAMIYAVTRKEKVIPVVEEFTELLCQNCPRGTVALEKLRGIYGENISLIAVHNNDPMRCKDYNPVLKNAAALPSAHVNRFYRGVDSYYGFEINSFGLGKLVEDCLAKVPAAVVTAKAEIADNLSLSVTSESEFLYTGDASEYALGYVVTEDGLHNDDWKQSNAYAGTNPPSLCDEPLFERWKNGTKSMLVEFDDVPLAAQGIENGIDESVPAKVTEGEKNTHSAVFDLSKNKILQDKKNIKVIVLLFDRFTGQIINSASAVPTVSTGIDEIAGNGEGAVVTARYTLDGRLINAPEKGVNIVKYSDGTVKKVIVR